MSDRPALPGALTSTGVVAIARAASTKRVVEAVETVVRAGVTCVEITMTTPGAVDAVAALAASFGETVCVGAGTVLTTQQARECIDVGAKFIVAPSVVPDVVEFASAQGIPVFPGALTPSEIVAAWLSGAAAVKVFPASAVGPQYVRDVRAPLPDIPLIPTGGVSIDDVPKYFAAGAIAVGVGGPLFGDALSDDGDLDALAARAMRLLDVVRAAREGQPL
ncbi:MAG TPA: bifunctional 4-hydroxy-2-oxoglutarate aldolase/2-dehydro-3-deoxy-phosphogluconate aldolase [Acidothermaceae bacterium]|nr:bifunctional 4-hydroxy-2-oxoglutarate aldolase/2-dehydro-3-deoxy-phosphogluconate aldolase [Acidothermaceae bacterium]